MQAALLRPREKKSVKSPVEKWSKYSPKQESATVYECRPTLEIIQRRTMLHLKAFQHWNQTFWQVLAFENTPYSDPNLDGWATVNVCWHLINYVNACDLLQIVLDLIKSDGVVFLVAAQIGLIFIFFISHCPLKLCTKLWYFEMKKKCWRNNKERWGMFNNTCNYQHQ